MRKIHAVSAALLIGIATMLGTYAVTRTTELGVQARTTPKQQVDPIIAQRTRKLEATQAALSKALAKKVPKLPALPALPRPRAARAQVATQSPQPQAQPQPRVVATTVRVASPAPAPRSNSPQHSDEQHARGGVEQDD
jgi:hypothetical protein